jgi:hypothetical protein
MSLSALFVKAWRRRRACATPNPRVRPALERLEERLVPAHLQLGLDPPPNITGIGEDDHQLRDGFRSNVRLNDNNPLEAVWTLSGFDVEVNHHAHFTMNANRLSLELVADPDDPTTFPVVITVTYSYDVEAHCDRVYLDTAGLNEVVFPATLNVLPADPQRTALFNVTASNRTMTDDFQQGNGSVSVNSQYVSSSISIFVEPTSFSGAPDFSGDADGSFYPPPGWQGEIDVDLTMTITAQVQGGGSPAPSVRPGGLDPTDGRMPRSSALNLDPIGRSAVSLVVPPTGELQRQLGETNFGESPVWLWAAKTRLTGGDPLPAVETGSPADTAGPHHGLSPVSREARSNWLMATFDSLELIGTAPSQWLDANPSE